MLPLIRVLGRWGGIVTIIILIITLLRQLIALVTFIIAAIKIGIIIAFIGLFLLIVLAMLRGRSERRREAEDL